MKLKRIFAALSVTVLLAGAAVPASAHHNGRGHAEAAASILGGAAQTVLDQAYASHKCVGALMASVGKLDEFHAERLRIRQERLQAQVESGSITQEEADQSIASMQEQQEYCNGAGYCDGSYHDSGICDGTCVGGAGYCDGSYHDNGVCDGTCVGGGSGWDNGACDGSGQGWGGHHGGGHHGGGHHGG